MSSTVDTFAAHASAVKSTAPVRERECPSFSFEGGGSHDRIHYAPTALPILLSPGAPPRASGLRSPRHTGSLGIEDLTEDYLRSLTIDPSTVSRRFVLARAAALDECAEVGRMVPSDAVVL